MSYETDDSSSSGSDRTDSENMSDGFVRREDSDENRPVFFTSTPAVRPDRQRMPTELSVSSICLNERDQDAENEAWTKQTIPMKEKRTSIMMKVVMIVWRTCKMSYLSISYSFTCTSDNS